MCAHPDCTTRPSYNIEGSTVPLFCREHKSDDMVDVRHKMCAHPDCTTIPSYNIKGSTVPLFCREHKSDDMVDVKNKMCVHPDCTTIPSYNVKGSTVRPVSNCVSKACLVSRRIGKF